MTLSLDQIKLESIPNARLIGSSAIIISRDIDLNKIGRARFSLRPFEAVVEPAFLCITGQHGVVMRMVADFMEDGHGTIEFNVCNVLGILLFRRPNGIS